MSSPLPDPPSGPYGWIVAGIVAILGAVGTFWTLIRGGRTQDSTTALTHANRIIKAHQDYEMGQDKRIALLESRLDERDKQWRADYDGLLQERRDWETRERRCQLRLDWLYHQLREHNVDVPPWPYGDDS